MFGFLNGWVAAAYQTFWFNQFNSIQQSATSIALISTGIRELAMWADATNISIGQKSSKFY
jgi:ABC-type antimicrobial peptide transport system ATPase subunit